MTSLPGEKGSGCSEAHLLDLGVDMRVLLDVLVLGRDVGLGLVVVVIGDEVLHPVLREELLELVVELGGQGLVVGDDQGGLLEALDDIGHGVGLARACDPQEGLEILAGPSSRMQPGGELLDGLGLGAGGSKAGYQMKLLQRSALGEGLGFSSWETKEAGTHEAMSFLLWMIMI